MLGRPIGFWVLAYALLWGVVSTPSHAQSVATGDLRTIAEQNARLIQFDRAATKPAQPRLARDPITLISDEVRRAQGTEPYYRRPVSQDQMSTIQSRMLRETGQRWPIERIAAAVDYTHAHMRESRTRSAIDFRLKLQRDLAQERKAFHGLVAELAEARERGMLLTKDTRSQTYDLTEDRARPRSLQLKVVQSPSAGLRELQSDLANADPRARHGVLPRQDIARLVHAGKLRDVGTAGGQRVYTTTSGPRVTVLPSQAVDSAASSQQYARAGRATVAAMTRTASIYRYATDGLAITGAVVAPLVLLEAHAHGLVAYDLLLDSSTRATALPFIHMAITVGHTAEAATLLWMTGSRFAVLRLETVTLFKLTATEVFLPVAVVVQGLKFGLAFYEYSSGRIGWERFRDRATGPALFIAFTSGGAALCTFVLPGLGTLACAVGGAIISIPVTWWDKSFRAGQREQFERELFQVRLDASEKALASVNTL